MSKLSKKLLVAMILTALAVEPMQMQLAQALIVNSGGSGTASPSAYNGGSSGNSSGGMSTSDPAYKGLPGTGGSQNASGGIGTGTSSTGYPNTSGGVGTGATGSANTSGGVGTGSSSGSSGNTSGGVSTSDASYKGVPGAQGQSNTSSGVGSGSSSTGNTSTGVSTTDPGYKGVPGAQGQPNTSTGVESGSADTGNTSTGVSTDSPDYKGVPGSRKPGPSKCGGRSYPSDIDGHWAEIYIRRLYDLCIVEGYKDGTFRPERNISRAELVKMSLFSKGINPDGGCYDNDCGTPFMDLDSWQGKWIRPAWLKGIVQGYNHDQFKPNKPITRAEAVKVILATYGYSPLSTGKSFFNDVQGWSVGWVERAHEIGLVQGVGNGNFDPNRPITRAEAAKVIAKMMEYWDTRIK